MSAQTTLPRVAVVGAGAIGGYLAAQLQRQQAAQVQVMARGESLRALRSRGLRLHEGDQHSDIALRASDDATAMGEQDWVILAVKAPALAEVAGAIGPLLGEHTRVLVAMNGVPWWFFQAGYGQALSGTRLRSADPEGRIEAAIATERVIGCVVHMSAAHLGPAEIRHVAGRRLIMGEPDHSLSPALTQMAACLRCAGLDVEVSSDIQRDIWYKLWGNLTMNPLSALTGASCDRLLDDELVRGYASAIMREAQAIGRHFGCDIDQDPEARHAVTRQLGAFKTSMLQDLEAARPLELDAIVSTVREMGQVAGLATPHLDALLGLTRLMAQTRGLY